MVRLIVTLIIQLVITHTSNTNNNNNNHNTHATHDND